MNKVEIAERLVARRKSLEVSQRQLADLCGISVHALSILESGRGNPTVDTLLKVCEVLGLPLCVGV